MRFVDRPDAPLLVGAGIALATILIPPLPALFGQLRSVESAFGVPILPAVAALGAGFLVYHQRRSQRSHTDALVAESARREAARRATENERLVAFGHAVARALDLDAMRSAVSQHLSRVTGSSQAWVLIRRGPGCELLAGLGPSDKEAERARSSPKRLSAASAQASRATLGRASRWWSAKQLSV